VLSWFEHNRAIRPSTLLNLYLLFSLVFDAVQVRTLYLRHDDSTILGLFTASIGLKLVLLLLEAKSKRGYLKPPYNRFSPETTNGIFDYSFFWWLLPVLTTGFKKILTLDDLFTTDQELLSESLQNQMQSSWNKCLCLSLIVANADSLQIRPLANMHWFMLSSIVCDGLWCQ
jgi:ATP-binding cassette subfamily C (CFTR/MRP) protein 1